MKTGAVDNWYARLPRQARDYQQKTISADIGQDTVWDMHVDIVLDK